MGRGGALRRLPLLCVLVLILPPRPLSGPSPGVGDTSKPGTMADAAWLRASAPLRGLLSRDRTGGARAGRGRRVRGEAGPLGGGAAGVTKRPAPPHVTLRFVTRPGRGT